MSKSQEFYVDVWIPYREKVKYGSVEELLRNDEKIQNIIEFLHEDDQEAYTQRDILDGADISRTTFRDNKQILNGNSRLELLLENDVLDERDTYDWDKYVRGESWEEYLES